MTITFGAQRALGCWTSAMPSFTSTRLVADTGDSWLHR